MSRNATYFLSDLHLGARYLSDPRGAERRAVRFLESVRDDAARIYLVGDILDYWYEYRYVVPRGFTRFFGKLAELADDGVKITWLIGNHDIWIFDYLPSELGIEVFDGNVETEIDGRRFFISHGDGIDDTSRSYNFLRALFRNRLCQKLYAAVHPRWTIPFALGWSRSSRSTSAEADVTASLDRLGSFAVDYNLTHLHVDFFIFGHLHVLVDEQLPDGARMIVLGEWIKTFSYAKFKEGLLTLEKFDD